MNDDDFTFLYWALGFTAGTWAKDHTAGEAAKMFERTRGMVQKLMRLQVDLRLATSPEKASEQLQPGEAERGAS